MNCLTGKVIDRSRGRASLYMCHVFFFCFLYFQGQPPQSANLRLNSRGEMAHDKKIMHIPHTVVRKCVNSDIVIPTSQLMHFSRSKDAPRAFLRVSGAGWRAQVENLLLNRCSHRGNHHPVPTYPYLLTHAIWLGARQSKARVR